MVYTIAIDGPAASGKSSAAEKVAEKLGFDRLDSGLLYRAITYILDNELEGNPAHPGFNAEAKNGFDKEVKKDLEGEEAKEIVKKIRLSLKNKRIIHRDKDITDFLRNSKIDKRVGIVAKILYIRNKVHEIQHEIIRDCDRGVVVDGRDIGTVVMPDAFLKIFITAKDTTRAKRRTAQNGENYAEILANIQERDYHDINREHGPLKVADDAIVIENDHMTLEETVDKVVELFKKRVEN